MPEPRAKIVNSVYSGEYRDSLFLMKLSNDISAWPDVEQAVIVMGTDGNKLILDQVGLLGGEAEQATAHDLIVAARTTRSEQAFIAALEALMRETDRKMDVREGYPSLGTALAARDDADLVFLAIPGEHVTPLARQALEGGKHVFCFSHHVSIEDEVALKRLALDRDLLMMGPDCGTAVLDGYGLGFANQVTPGPIGLVSASGSGLQEVISLIDRHGGGISQAIGVGGRDLSEEVGGLMCVQAIRKLTQSRDIKVIVILAKKAAPDAIRGVLAAGADAGIPLVADFVRGSDLTSNSDSILVDTFEEAARQALRQCGIGWSAAMEGTEMRIDLSRMVAGLTPSRRRVHGLFGGGSLCAEAGHILEQHGLSVRTNFNGPLPADAGGHILLDLGGEEFTQGRPHPFIDPRTRSLMLTQSWSDPEVAILLLDVVLGRGCHPDPAGELAKVLIQLKTENGNPPVVIASVCGTEADPQGYSQQRRKLIDAGVLVMESNAKAAILAAEAARILEGSRV